MAAVMAVMSFGERIDASLATATELGFADANTLRKHSMRKSFGTL
jgi:hypothetical protein